MVTMNAMRSTRSCKNKELSTHNPVPLRQQDKGVVHASAQMCADPELNDKAFNQAEMHLGLCRNQLVPLQSLRLCPCAKVAQVHECTTFTRWLDITSHTSTASSGGYLQQERQRTFMGGSPLPWATGILAASGTAPDGRPEMLSTSLALSTTSKSTK
jgi:hypothetical protein